VLVILVVGLFVLASLALLIPQGNQLVSARRFALAPLVEVTGPEIWSRTINGFPAGLRPAAQIAFENLQGAPVGLVAVGFVSGFLLLLALLRWCIGAPSRANAATEQSAPNLQSKRIAEELQFLPAALEIVETPPSPIGRAIGATLIALFCAALAWASVSNIDIVASAPGKIIPTGRTKVIQPFETGVVRAILVHDGQRVKSGDTVIELDSTMNAAEADHLKADLIAAKLEIARMEAALSDGENPVSNFHPPDGASPSLIAMQQKYLVSQVSEQRAKLESLDRQKAQKDADVATIAATINKLEATIPIIEHRVAIRESLNEFGTKLAYLETLQLLTEQQEELKVQRAHLREAEAAVAAIVQMQAQAAEEYRRTQYAGLVETERKAAGLRQDLIKAEELTKRQLLTTPVDGVVQQLSIHTVGGIVTPAQALLAVVPDDSHLEIEAMVANKDIGFVHAGQPAEIKVETFNFTRYGLLHGRVLSVSTDAISRSNQQNGSGDRQQGDSESRGQELIYSARISLDQPEMQIEDKLVPLEPGMAVTVEINTGSRRLISYLLSPLAKYRHESARER
jgi:hemolysin D